jgi:hypothetical protein
MTEQASAQDTAAWTRRLASQANNRGWALSEKLSRTQEEDEDMLHAAHAAMHLWKQAGQPGQIAHAALLLAHTYALQRLGQPAAHHLAQATPWLFAEGRDAWEVALAHAVAANVAAANQDAVQHQAHHGQAVGLIDALPDPEDRNILRATLAVVPKPSLGWLGIAVKPRTNWLGRTDEAQRVKAKRSRPTKKPCLLLKTGLDALAACKSSSKLVPTVAN